MTSQSDKIVQGLIQAYAQGWFPMADPSLGPDHIHWLSPDPRGIIPLDQFHVSKNLAKRVRSEKFVIRTDTAFVQVIQTCARDSTDEGSWINEQIIDAYVSLHEAGNAHSIEAWLKLDQLPEAVACLPPAELLDESGTHLLVGGLYGVHIGGLFAGESMFSKPELGGTDASKVCLVHLVHHLRALGFTVLDTQFVNQHLSQFGCADIPRDEYMDLLAKALANPAAWQPFDATRAVQKPDSEL